MTITTIKMIYYKPTQSVFANRKALKTYLFDRYVADKIDNPTNQIYEVLYLCAVRRGEVLFIEDDKQ